MRKYFGTDGVRGIANKELSAELTFNLGRAGAYVLKNHSKHASDRVKVVVGTDTRISKDMLTYALGAGVMSVGADVLNVGELPTPAIAYLTRELKADVGVVISASHNPMEYNGIKFFNSEGFKLADEIELEIEEYLEDMSKIKEYSSHENIGKLLDITSADKMYMSFLKNAVPTDFSNLKIVLDCSNGAAYKIAPTVFRDLGANVISIGTEPNGTNINKDSGSTHTKGLQERVLEEGADMGLAYDGDADRLIAVDEKGNVVDGDKIMLIAAAELMNQGKLKDNTLVVTVMSNLGLHIAAKELGINLAVTAVGDRYVLEEMVNKDFSLGGEQSGHMIFLDYNTTGDGILSSLILASIIVKNKKNLSSLSEIMDIYPQVLINAKVKNKNKNAYLTTSEIVAAIEKIEADMAGKGRVLIRPSGTEPLVRVMIEGKNKEEIYEKAENLAQLIESKLA